MRYLVAIAGLLAGGALLAAAQPAGGESPPLPDGWRELPELVLAAEAGGPVRVESRAGFGDPSAGCFALVQRVSGEHATFEAARAALVAGLERRGLEVSGEGDELAVKGLGVEGRVRTAMRAESGGRFAAVSAACFYNDRQPERCKAQCDGLLDRLGGG